MRQPSSRKNVVLSADRGDRVGATRVPPSPDLSVFVEACWTSFWDLPPGEVHRVEILTDASGHVVFEPGFTNVVGVVTRKFTRELTGRGRVVGLKLKAGALRAVTGRRAWEFTNRRCPLPVDAEADLRASERTIFGADDDSTRFALAEGFLRGHLAHNGADRWAAQLAAIESMLARIERDFETLRVETLASDFDLSARSLQRLFKEHVGVGPKWVIKRQRLLRAAEQLKRGEVPSLTTLAAALGYFDQAHFAHEFSAIVGHAPVAYKRTDR
jgi:AraC-like DNA-binding protein